LGLSLVEYVMAVEEAFGISIPEEDTAQVRTARDLVDYLLPRITTFADPLACSTQRTFLALRRGIMDVMNVPRQRIRPETRWNDLLPMHGRARKWHALHRHVANQNVPAFLSALLNIGAALLVLLFVQRFPASCLRGW